MFRRLLGGGYSEGMTWVFLFVGILAVALSTDWADGGWPFVAGLGIALVYLVGVHDGAKRAESKVL